MGLSAISLFSGAGGLDLAARWAGIRTVCYVEWWRRAQLNLISRIAEGSLDDAPIWDDVTTFDGRPWRGKVDCIIGGFPCQDVAACGHRAGITQETRSGLWFQFARIIGEVGPRFVFVENVANLIMGGGIGVVLGQLSDLGYDAEWGVVSSSDTGANHERKRCWIVAYPAGFRRYRMDEKQKVIVSGIHCQVRQREKTDENNLLDDLVGGFSNPSCGKVRNDDGLAEGMDRLKLCGNGVDPYAATPALKFMIEIAKDLR